MSSDPWSVPGAIRNMSPIQRFEQLARVTAGLDGATESSAQLLNWLRRREVPELPLAADRWTTILLALLGIDSVLGSEAFGEHRQPYIVGLRGLEDILGDRTPDGVGLLRADVAALSAIGIIYAFDVARKFQCPSSGEVQIRCNGWSRELSLDPYESQGHSMTLRSKIFRSVSSTLTPYKQTYAVLANLLRAQITDESSETLWVLNASVPVPVVN
jgi:hypothetical protein